MSVVNKEATYLLTYLIVFSFSVNSIVYNSVGHTATRFL